MSGLIVQKIRYTKPCVGKDYDASLFQNGPELLPRVNMLLLLKTVISTATPRLQVFNFLTVGVTVRWGLFRVCVPHFRVLLQVLASQCLTALCASAGGGDGCTVAEQPEIDVLLNALLSPCFSVRDAALRVSRVRL